MKNIALRYSILLLSIIVLACKKQNNEDFITKEMKIESDTIRKLELNRGILTMRSFRNYIHMYSWCPLVYKNSFPSWIEDKHEPDFSFDKYIFEPCISDIDLPYEIYKKANENYFFIVKNQDTLKFKIVE
jgi:hypothetical protein